MVRAPRIRRLCQIDIEQARKLASFHSSVLRFGLLNRTFYIVKEIEMQNSEHVNASDTGREASGADLSFGRLPQIEQTSQGGWPSSVKEIDSRTAAANTRPADAKCTTR